MDAVPYPTPWSTVAALPDCLLLSQTVQLARHEQALQILVLDHLHEIEARRLHLTRGYGSLFDYVVHELGYTAAAAWRRIKAMRLCSQTGAARELLQDGSLNLSNAAQLQNLFERSDRSHGRPPGGIGANGGLGGAPRSGGAPGEPASAPPTRAGERNPEPAPAGGPVLDAAAREELVRQAAGKSTREVQQMLAEVDPELARPSDRMRALGGGRWELKAAVDAECRHGLEKLQMLLSHTDPHLTLGALVARLVRDGLHRYDPARPPRARRTGTRRSGVAERSASAPPRRDTEAVERSVAGAEGGGVERQSEVERDDASFAAAVPNNLSGPSAPKRPAKAERGGPKSAPARDTVRRSESAPKRDTEAEQGSTESAPVGGRDGHTTSLAKRHSVTGHASASRAAAPNSGAHTTSPAKCRSEAQPGRRPHAVAQNGTGPAVSAAKRDTEAERSGPNSAPVRDTVRRSESAAKRVMQDEGVQTEEAARLDAGAAWAPGRGRETEHGCGPPRAMHGNGGWGASPAKRHGKAAGDGRDVGVHGVLERAPCAHGPRVGANRRNASWSPVPGDRRFPTVAAKRLAYADGHGAVGPAERSPAVERHLATLRSFGALPGSQSRYIPVAVKREVWRRDQGCCSYVDRHSGRRCGSRYRLEIDHIVPFALGGGAEPANLRLRCEAHHRLRHAQRHGHPAR